MTESCPANQGPAVGSPAEGGVSVPVPKRAKARKAARRGSHPRGRDPRSGEEGATEPSTAFEVDDGEEGSLADELPGSLYRTMAGAFVLHTKFKAVFDEICSTIDDCHGVEDEPPCMHVAGPSGAGKSTIAAKLLVRYPVVRDGRSIRQSPLPDEISDYVPLLVLRMPTQPTVITVGQEILRTYGDPKWFMGGRASVERRVRRFIKRCGTRAVVLDDAQRAVDRNGTVVKIDLVDWLKELHQSNGVILILVGLNRLRHLFEEDGDQIERRYDAPLELTPYSWVDSSGDDCTEQQDQFLAIVSGVISLSPLSFSPEVNVDNEDGVIAELALKRFYYASQGLVGMLVKLLKMAMRIAQRDPDRHVAVTLGLLEEACAKAFRLERRGMRNAFAADWLWQLPPAVLDDTMFVRKPTRRKTTKRSRERDLMDGLTK